MKKPQYYWIHYYWHRLPDSLDHMLQAKQTFCLLNWKYTISFYRSISYKLVGFFNRKKQNFFTRCRNFMNLMHRTPPFIYDFCFPPVITQLTQHRGPTMYVWFTFDFVCVIFNLQSNQQCLKIICNVCDISNFFLSKNSFKIIECIFS